MKREQAIMRSTTIRMLRPASLILLLSLSACIAVPEQFRGSFAPLSPFDATADDVGAPIRWGGVILEARPEQDRTCFELLSRRLSSSMRPVQTDQTQGRFIACKVGFHDPEIFARGREMTLTGSIAQIETRKVGEFNYRYPVVDTDFITLWPERRDVIIYDSDPFFSPWFWHYPFVHPRVHPTRLHHDRRGRAPRVEVQGKASAQKGS